MPVPIGELLLVANLKYFAIIKGVLVLLLTTEDEGSFVKQENYLID